MDSLNTIKACHFRFKDGILCIAKKEYFWHIPKLLRDKDIKKGDIVLVNSKGKKVRVLVVDVFRENIEDTGKRYEKVFMKLESRK